MPVELLVPIGIFVVGIIISVVTGGLGIQRLVESQKATSKDLTHTAAYEAITAGPAKK